MKAQLLGYGNPVTHRLSENRIHFASRIPTVYAGDLIKTFSKSFTSFSQSTLIKSDALGLDGYWNAFPVRLLPEGFVVFRDSIIIRRVQLILMTYSKMHLEFVLY